MRERIGFCEICGKEIHCENGFFDGVHEKGKLYCHACIEDKSN